ncbi:MAG: hypothetical protein V4663_07395 [Bacteroidota bacterium]
MKKNYLYSYLFLTLFFASCKKDISPADLIGDYEAASLAVGTNTKMYVKGKVITDGQIIYDFLDRKDWYYSSTKNYKEIAAPDWFTFNLSIKKDNRTYIEYEVINEIDPVRFAGTAEISNNELTVRALKQDTMVTGSFSDHPHSKVWKPILPEDQYKTWNHATTGQPLTQIISTKKSIFVVKNNEIYLPMLIVVSPTRSPYSRVSSFTSSTYSYYFVNPNLSASLADRDTIVVQEYLVKMIKQK